MTWRERAAAAAGCALVASALAAAAAALPGSVDAGAAQREAVESIEAANALPAPVRPSVVAVSSRVVGDEAVVLVEVSGRDPAAALQLETDLEAGVEGSAVARRRALLEAPVVTQAEELRLVRGGDGWELDGPSAARADLIACLYGAGAGLEE